jgi:HD-GYP domain-containing protein (c-di-GMP phosphodiesterase class II)
MSSSEDTKTQRIADLERLLTVGVALASERNTDKLMLQILLEAKSLCMADGGTLYLVNDDETQLEFAIIRNDTLGVMRGGDAESRPGLPPVPLRNADGKPNLANVASCAANQRTSINIDDAYTAKGFDFSGTKRFDKDAGYRSKSFLTIPMQNSEGRVIGVLQLINARNSHGDVVGFDVADQRIAEALAAQAAVALDNQLLLLGQRKLLESFIQLIANAIDAKSPYTGGHCARVPVLTQMLAEAACNETTGSFSSFTLDEDEWYELRIAAWLHDCGKIVTPTHVMDKATKLEAIHDRIHEVAARMEVLARDCEIRCLQAQLANPSEASAARATCDAEVASLRADLEFLRTVNIGAEFTSPEAVARVQQMAARTVVLSGVAQPLLSTEEVDNLRISRGTLTHHERLVINGHMVHTIRMLEALPFPRGLRRVPEYAGGHHEKMDGTGYPRGLFGTEMSIPARLMAIADVFEALTAQDRPYKKAKSLSETMTIMGHMKRDNHLDPELFDLFVRSGVYRRYAERYLPPNLLDAVDEAALLAITPKAFAPANGAVQRRRGGFLEAYETAIPARAVTSL